MNIKEIVVLQEKIYAYLDAWSRIKMSTNSAELHYFTASWMWELDGKEGWAPKNWCFWIVVLEKTPESPMDCKEIQPVHPKGHQPWIFMGRTDAEASIIWPPDAKSQLIGKDPDAGKDWGQEKKGVTEDKMTGYHHWLSGHMFDQTSGNNEVQGNLACCSSWGHKELDMTDNWTPPPPYNS